MRGGHGNGLDREGTEVPTRNLSENGAVTEAPKNQVI